MSGYWRAWTILSLSRSDHDFGHGWRVGFLIRAGGIHSVQDRGEEKLLNVFLYGVLVGSPRRCWLVIKEVCLSCFSEDCGACGQQTGEVLVVEGFPTDCSSQFVTPA